MQPDKPGNPAGEILQIREKANENQWSQVRDLDSKKRLQLF